MKDARSLMLIVLSSLLFVVSFVLLWTWGYRIYIKAPAAPAITAILEKKQPAEANDTRDSLTHIYDAVLHTLDSRFDSAWEHADSVKQRLDIRLGEFYRLKTEIERLLKNHGADADLGIARTKISELQQRVKDLLDKNLDVEYENKKLAAVLQQLSVNGKPVVSNARHASFESKQPSEKKETVSGLFTSSELNLAAMKSNADKDMETNQSQETEKLVGSFNIRNLGIPNSNTELMVIVIQPDGQVMKNSAWESGTFLTEEGKKIYSCKLHFEYSQGETKRLNFSIISDKYPKGNYTMQIYQNGVQIGKIQKFLS